MSAARGSRAAVLALALLVGARASAQDARGREEARARFERGVAYIEAERWADAITELQRAREIRATPAVLYNLGLAYRAVGRSRDAVAAFRDFVAASSGAANPELMARVRAYLQELTAGIARLDLQVEPPSARVLLDGVEVQTRQPHELDAGRHVIVAEADGYAAQTRALELGRGARESLRLRLVPLAPPRLTVHAAPPLGVARPAPQSPAPESHGVLQSPWFWVGVGVVAAGAGVATYFALHEGTPTYQGTLGTVTDAFTVGRWR